MEIAHLLVSCHYFLGHSCTVIAADMETFLVLIMGYTLCRVREGEIKPRGIETLHSIEHLQAAVRFPEGIPEKMICRRSSATLHFSFFSCMIEDNEISAL